MATNEIAKLGYQVDSNGLLVADRRLRKTMESSKKTESGIKELDRSFIGLSGAIGVAATALASFGVGSKLLNEARNFDVFMAQLKTATGGIESARVEFENLSKFAASTPFDLGQSIDGFVKLKNLGLDPSIESMTSFGNTASAMGKSLNQMIEAVADASTNEFERLKEFGIKARQETDRVIFTFQGVETAVAKNSEAIQKYLREIGDVNFARAMEDRANSLDGALSNLGDTWDGLFRAISNQGVGSVIEGGVRGATDVIQYLIDNMDALEDSFKFLVLSGGAYAAFLGVKYVASSFAATSASGLLSAALTTQAGRAMAATAAMNALGVATRFALGPWGLLIGAIGAAATVFVTSKNQAAEMMGVIDDAKSSVSGLVDQYKELDKAMRADFARNNMKSIIELGFEMAGLEAKIEQTNKAMSGISGAGIAGVSAANIANMRKENRERELQLAGLKAEFESRKEASKAISDLAKSLKDAEDAQKKENEARRLLASNKQIESLKQMQKEIGMTSDELFVFREVQKSIANKDAPKVTEEIELLAKSVVKARNELKTFGDIYGQVSQVDSFALKQAKDYDQWIASIYNSFTTLDDLENKIADIAEAMYLGDIDWSVGLKAIDEIKKQIEDLKNKSKDSMSIGSVAGDLREGILAFREFGEEGTKEYKRLTRAAQAFAAVQAFATGNILAGFAQVASVLGSIGGGDLKDISAEVQATQNLNVWGDKADSISRSMQITANATDKLVGINTSMLKALQIMQQGIAKASGLIVRDSVTPQVNTDALGIMDNPLQQSFLKFTPIAFADKLLGGVIGGLLGGKSKVVDEGIRIVGGTMSRLMEDVLVQGYQQVKYKKWRWGSTKRKTAFSNMDSSVGDQFSLVFGSIADSVYDGATMLGLSGSAVEEAINNFTISTKQISLKGLSAERQQKEIEAYFSRIFDGLALKVVDFLPEFQKVGESYGETLTRIATQVAVLDEVSTRFGTNFGNKMANPELYAKAADNIATLTGGLEEFINKTAGFTRFADEATQVEIAQNDLNRALAEVGLSLPSSTAGMWELMQSIDGSTDAGQKQIATLLNLQDSSYTYYQMLERQNEQYKNLSRNLRGIIESTYGLSSAAAQTSLDAAIAAAKIGDFGLALSGNFAAAMPKQSDFESFADFAFEQAVTANKLEELAKLSDGQISVEERQLSQLEQINQALRDSYVPTQSNDKLVRATKELNVTQQKTNEILHKISRSTEASEKIQRAMIE